jgi:hypothetical protein
MPIEQTATYLKRQHFMLSDYPPWQVYRWTYDTQKQINVIERFDVAKDQWIKHDNALLRGAFMDQQDAGLSNIEPVTDAQAKKLSLQGLTSEK